MKRLLTLALLAGIATVAIAQAPPAIARYVPPGPDRAHVFVLDSAHILSPATIAALQDSALALQRETHADVAWVTLPTLGGRAIEEAALYIGRTWRIGNAGEAGDPLRNRGLVVLYVPDKAATAGSNFRIEVGNGLEGTITDSRSRTITTAMREDLRAKRYDAAYMKGWTVAAALVREDFASHGVAAPPPHEPNYGALVLAVVVIGLAFLILFRWTRAQRTGMSRRGFRRSAIDPDVGDPNRRRIVQSSSDAGLLSGFDGGGSSDSGSSSGGEFGGGGGFSGGGSSDSI